jgi:hypothetical protein
MQDLSRSVSLLRCLAAGVLVAPLAVMAQIRVLDAPLIYVCRPEIQPHPMCARGQEGFAMLTGAQARLMRELASLSASSSRSDVEKILREPPVQVADAGTAAYLEGKKILRRAWMWRFSPQPRSDNAMDKTILVTFANDTLMNVQLGGVAIHRSNIYFATLECDPNCGDRLTPGPTK